MSPLSDITLLLPLDSGLFLTLCSQHIAKRVHYRMRESSHFFALEQNCSATRAFCPDRITEISSFTFMMHSRARDHPGKHLVACLDSSSGEHITVAALELGGYMLCGRAATLDTLRLWLGGLCTSRTTSTTRQPERCRCKTAGAPWTRPELWGGLICRGPSRRSPRRTRLDRWTSMTTRTSPSSVMET